MCTAAGRPATELNQKRRLITANSRAAAGAEPAGLAAGGRAALGFRCGTSQAKTTKSRVSLGRAPPPHPAPGHPGPSAHSGCQCSPSHPRDLPHLTGERTLGSPTPPCPVPETHLTPPGRDPSAPPTPRRSVPSAEIHLTGEKALPCPVLPPWAPRQ